MAFALTWLPETLEAAGLKVAEVPDWRTRGRAEMGTVRGIICHHTVGGPTGNMPSLGLVTRGRPNLPGPLCHLGLGRDGTYYVVAAGRANHAGEGEWEGIATGNTSFIGIEAENMGTRDDHWPDVQMDAYRRGAAAILKHVGAPARMCCGHREYAPTRKIDPLFDMDAFRTGVAAIMAGTGTVRPQIPAVDAKNRPTLRRGDRSPAVTIVQTKLGVDPIGTFGPKTEAAVRQLQRHAGLVPDGIVGPKTWALLDETG